jgi:hypothetical protein
MNMHVSDTRMQGGWLLVAPLGWLAIAGLTVGLTVAGLTIALQRPDLVGPALVDKATRSHAAARSHAPLQLPPAERQGSLAAT